MERRILYGMARWWILLVFLTVSCCLGACGYSKEEKARMEGLQSLGRENAVTYIEEKYGFTPEVDDIKLCLTREEGDSLPWANGDVLAFLRRGEEAFTVQISGEKVTREGADDLQYGLICQEAREYFQELLGYEFHDFYLGYGEESCETFLIHSFYHSGSLEDFLKQYPVRIRIDDCINQDLTEYLAGNQAASLFFENYGENWGMKALLISYRSRKEYQLGSTHTYNEGGPIAFDIGKDGLYIRSYAVFSEEEETSACFELQEYDGMVFCCEDLAEGMDLVISADTREWMDLGEARGSACSKVYSVARDMSGEITIYIPEEAFPVTWTRAYVQHYEDAWWQYEVNLYQTVDKTYRMFTYHGYGRGKGNFDFALFP